MKTPTSNWLIELTRLSAQMRESEKQTAKRSEPVRPPQFTPDEKRQTIVGGKIPYEPINKQAAMLLCKGDDWLTDPNLFREKKSEPEKKKRKKGKNKMSHVSEDVVTNAPKLPIPKMHGVPRGQNPEDWFDINDVAAKVIAHINKQPHQLSSLARAGIDARNLLDENLKALGQGYEEFNARVKVCLEDLRQSRFAFVTETSQMIQPLKDIRQFLLGKDYEEEIKRLKEFVDLCERLQRLKQDGTLDAVADTMIKLAI